MEEKNLVKNETKRETNMDLLRIVGMLMVITIHCLSYNLVYNPQINIFNSLIIKFLDILVIPANAIFILLSAYYSIDKKFNLKRILNLWGKTIFYSLLIFLLFKIFGQKTNDFQSLFPVISGQYWFIDAYLIMSFLSPILNIIMNKLNKKQNTFLVIFGIVTLGVIRVLVNPTGILMGAMLPFIFLYIIGAYIKKYVDIRPKELYMTKYILIAVIITLLSIIIYSVAKRINNAVIIYLLTIIFNGIEEYNSLLGVLMSVYIFMRFRTITIKSKTFTKIISFIVPSIFSVYLIHENVNLKKVLWVNLGIMNFANSWLMVPYILLMIISVFITCVIIDLIKRGIYYLVKKIPFVYKCINILNTRIEKINLKINNYLAEETT